MIHALQGFAGACKCPLSKGISLLCLAVCCTVLRSWWYQIGINNVLKVPVIAFRDKLVRTSAKRSPASRSRVIDAPPKSSVRE
jgi:hypothetical protein